MGTAILVIASNPDVMWNICLLNVLSQKELQRLAADPWELSISPHTAQVLGELRDPPQSLHIIKPKVKREGSLGNILVQSQPIPEVLTSILYLTCTLDNGGFCSDSVILRRLSCWWKQILCGNKTKCGTSWILGRKWCPKGPLPGADFHQICQIQRLRSRGPERYNHFPRSFFSVAKLKPKTSPPPSRSRVLLSSSLYLSPGLFLII